MPRSSTSNLAASLRSIGIKLGLVLALASGGAATIRIFRGTSWLESFYLALVSLSTLGSRDVAQGPHERELMIFMIIYVILGLSTFAYLAADVGRFILSAEFRKHLERRRMDRNIASLKNHFIVCGLGLMGRAICDYLHHHNQAFVVIDTNDELLEETCKPLGWLYVVGDASSDQILKQAGIERARSLATVLPTDADNVYVILSARLLASKLQIVARASSDAAIEKMQRAGATRVISPLSSGAVKMARFMLSPSVENFLEITDKRSGDLELADIDIRADSRYLGMRLAETDFRERGVMVIGINRVNGEQLLPPPGSAVIEVGDSLFVFGSTAAVHKMIAEAGVNR